MNFDGALISEEGVTFGIIAVRPHVLRRAPDQAAAVGLARTVWGPVPIVLMAQDARGVPTYWGRNDLVRYLANARPSRIPWKHYTVTAGSPTAT